MLVDITIVYSAIEEDYHVSKLVSAVQLTVNKVK